MNANDLCAKALKQLKAEGAGEAVAHVTSVRDGYLRFAGNSPTLSAESERRRLTLHAAVGQRHASGSTEDLSPAGISRLAGNVAASAKTAPEDPEHVPEAAAEKYPAVPSYDPAVASIEPSKRAALVAPVLEAALSSGLIAAGLQRDLLTEETRLSSSGAQGSFRKTRVELSATLRKPDGSASSWGGAAGVHLADVDPVRIAARAAEKAKAWTEPQELPPGPYTVVLEPRALTELFPSFERSLDARSAEEGRSAFSAPEGKSREGQALFSPSVTIVSDPQDHIAPGRPWSEGGLAARSTAYVQAGILTRLRRSRYWARKTGKPATADGGSVRVVGGGLSLEQLIAKVERGLLITRIWYVRMLDPQRIGVTGLTRDATFLIEGGHLSHAVKNFRFNQSMVDLFRDVEGLGREEASLGGGDYALPPVLVKEFHMSSVSEAV
jgi:predicted Zn-dependent protease